QPPPAGAPPDYGIPYGTETGVTVDLLNNFPRSISTYGDAVKRHNHWRDVFAQRAQNASNPVSRALYNTYASWRGNRANWYQRQSDGLGRLTSGLPYSLAKAFGPTAPDRVKTFLGATGVDRWNRLVADPDAKGGVRPLTRGEQYGFTHPRPSTQISSFGAKEWLRRGATKVSGLFSAPAALADGAYGVLVHGESVPHAVGRAGSGLVVGTASGALAQAAVAATVPGAGWAVAAGIGMGVWVGSAWDRSGASEHVAKGFEKASDSFGRGDVMGGLGHGLGSIGQGVGSLGKQMGKDVAWVGGKVGEGAQAVGRFVGGLFS
ncbi:MAG: hypothetical protein ACRDXB_07310, partial [Actinomycetes bacterium]